MREDYATAYTELASRHWWWRSRRSFVLGHLEAIAPTNGWHHILDVGCGSGEWFEALEQYGKVEGVEPDPSLARQGREKGRRIHSGRFDQQFRPERCYGLILFLDVLEHLDDPQMALCHASRLLEIGGKVVVTVPAFNLLWTNHDVINEHRRRYSRRLLVKQVEESGLLRVHDQYLYQWVFAAKIVIRLTEKVFGLSPRIPRVPPWPVNEFLCQVSRIEQKLRLGRLIPFGSSLFLIADRLPEPLDC